MMFIITTPAVRVLETLGREMRDINVIYTEDTLGSLQGKEGDMRS